MRRGCSVHACSWGQWFFCFWKSAPPMLRQCLPVHILSCLIDTWCHCMQSFCCYQSQAIVLQPGEYPQLSHMYDMGMHSISDTVTQTPVCDLLLQGDPQHAWRRCFRQSAAASHTFQADWLQPHVKHVRRCGSSKHRTKLSETYN